jgi:hypothetical protein
MPAEDRERMRFLQGKLGLGKAELVRRGLQLLATQEGMPVSHKPWNARSKERAPRKGGATGSDLASRA